jgi:hypothetical protein
MVSRTNGGGCGDLDCEITIPPLNASFAAGNLSGASARNSRITWPCRT